MRRPLVARPWPVLLVTLTWMVGSLGLMGCASTPASSGDPSAMSPPPLPDALANQVLVSTREDEIKVQVATFLNEDLSRRHFLVELEDEGVLGIFLRIENRSGTRVLVADRDCHLYAKEGETFREIPRLQLEQTAQPFLQGTWPVWSFQVPFSILMIPFFFVGVKGLFQASEQLDAIHLRNSIVYENFVGWRWGKRALGPGSIEKGVLFFDWNVAEQHRDELYLAVDMRDLVNDWHTVLPVRLRITYTDGWFGTTYH